MNNLPDAKAPSQDPQRHATPRPFRVRKRSNVLLEKASQQELVFLVLAMQDEYAKLKETMTNLTAQYKDLEAENEEVHTMMEKSATEISKLNEQISSIESTTKASEQAHLAEISRLEDERTNLAGLFAKLYAKSEKANQRLLKQLEV
jgi:predicted  nucleic acid-binding Zn-ribbon protein